MIKFSTELENELVPEWRAKYLDYKRGKRKIAAFSRALRNINANTTTTGPAKRTNPISNLTSSPNVAAPHSVNPILAGNEVQPGRQSNAAEDNELSLPISISRQTFSDPERQPLKNDEFSAYGSIVGSPADDTDWGRPKKSPVHSKLPVVTPELHSHGHLEAPFQRKPSPLAHIENANASETGGANYASLSTTLPGGYTKLDSLPSMKRLMSLGGNRVPSSGSLPLEAYRELDARQVEFFEFLDAELEKIESFYKIKEMQATERLKILREQLHVMRDCHIDELVRTRTDNIRAHAQTGAPSNGETKETGHSTGRSWLDAMDNALETARHASFRKNTKGVEKLPSIHVSSEADGHRDYIRHSSAHEIPYRTAKIKLKAAMHEFYRGLELLKSYALVNRKAFRKMNKKFDKAAGIPPTLQYMSEKVNEAHFVKSHVLGGHIRAVEDLYARYFEGGNYKVASSKLHATADRPNDYNGPVFRNGLMAATGLWFGIAGLSSAYGLLYHPNLSLAINTSFLLQIYAGYFLMLLLMLLFCADCKLWNMYKVNYVFIFEFDSRHHLDWRQLAELPCFCLLLLGLFLWLNFAILVDNSLFLFYPAILIGLTALLIFLPAPTLFYRSRSWFLYSNWRLFFSGLYPVEFRDFFMGDMFCSLTYSIGNIELFFCLYGHDWNNPDSCTSSHSRVLGFLSTLPGIWRTLQCLRRYWDTGNKFPHIANCLKYLFTVSYYATLSMYRLNKTNELFAIFIAFATVNALYCSVWDLVMDWSLLDPFAPKKFLRDHLAFQTVWIYYTAMVIDPILRFNWIFYAILTNDTKHSAVISFLVALSEILRRGIWTIFRVENEHCTNVGRVRASRDFPLPYKIEHQASEEHVGGHGYFVSAATAEEDSAVHEEHRRQGVVPPGLVRATSYTSSVSILGAHVDHSDPSPTAIRRKKRLEANPLLRRVGSILHTAHAQDFERKKRTDADKVKHSKDDEEEDVMDTHGSKVDDAKVEVAKRVAEALAERAAKDAEQAEEEEEALLDLAWEGDEQTGESSAGIEGRVKWRLRGPEEDRSDVNRDGGAQSPGTRD